MLNISHAQLNIVHYHTRHIAWSFTLLPHSPATTCCRASIVSSAVVSSTVVQFCSGEVVAQGVPPANRRNPERLSLAELRWVDSRPRQRDEDCDHLQ